MSRYESRPFILIDLPALKTYLRNNLLPSLGIYLDGGVEAESLQMVAAERSQGVFGLMTVVPDQVHIRGGTMMNNNRKYGLLVLLLATSGWLSAQEANPNGETGSRGRRAPGAGNKLAIRTFRYTKFRLWAEIYQRSTTSIATVPPRSAFREPACCPRPRARQRSRAAVDARQSNSM